MIQRPPRSTHSPYTTLFRSRQRAHTHTHTHTHTELDHTSAASDYHWLSPPPSLHPSIPPTHFIEFLSLFIFCPPLSWFTKMTCPLPMYLLLSLCQSVSVYPSICPSYTVELIHSLFTPSSAFLWVCVCLCLSPSMCVSACV